MFELIALVCLVLFVAIPAGIAQLAVRGTRQRLVLVEAELRLLKEQLKAQERPSPSQAARAQPGPVRAATDIAAPVAEAPARPADAVPPTTRETEPERETDYAAAEGTPTKETPSDEKAADQPAEAVSAPKKPGRSFETEFGTRWLVWLGGATVLLAGVFLVKHSIENNLISPALRVTLGCLAGLALIAGSEWVRRRPFQRLIAAVSNDHIPAALSAAGVGTLFGSLYAGYALYDLTGPLVTFALLAGVAVLALGLSLLQGSIVAVLGIVAAYGLPLLISSSDPNGVALFGYLTFVSAAGLAVTRYRRWDWLSGAVLAGSLIWSMLWITTQTTDHIAVAAFILIVFALLAGHRFEELLKPLARSIPPQDALSKSVHAQILFAGAIVALFQTFLLLPWTAYGAVGVVTLCAIVVAAAILARRAPRLELLILPVAITCLMVIATWQENALVAVPGPDGFWRPSLQSEVSDVVLAWDSIFVRMAAAAALFLGLFCGWAVQRTRTPGLWGAVSAFAPVLVMALAYMRIDGTGLDIAWAAISVALAVAMVLAAAAAARHRAVPGMEIALGTYAIAALAALGFGGAVYFEERWWAIFASLLIAGSGWVQRKAHIPYLRPVLAVLAGVVLLRTALSTDVFFLPFLQEPRSMLEVLYVFGIPAVAFYAAARWFAEERRDTLTSVLEAGALGFILLLVAMEARRVLGVTTVSQPGYSLLEQSINVIVWLASAALLSSRVALQRTTLSWPIRKWGAIALLALAAGQTVISHVGISNPVLTYDPVGSIPVLNTLLLAYGAPAVGFLYFAYLAHRRVRDRRWEQGLVALAGVLGFVLISLEVRQFFHGSVIGGFALMDAENYTLSVVWLVATLATLSVGLWLDRVAVRQVGIALLALVVLKVFVWDMSSLDGLLRVASFLGLGLSLIGIGFLYQRLVFRSAARAAQTGADSAEET